jgi:hypothetical protein
MAPRALGTQSCLCVVLIDDHAPVTSGLPLLLCATATRHSRGVLTGEAAHFIARQIPLRKAILTHVGSVRDLARAGCKRREVETSGEGVVVNNARTVPPGPRDETFTRPLDYGAGGESHQEDAK